MTNHEHISKLYFILSTAFIVQSLKSISYQSFGGLNRYQFTNFVLLDPREKKEFQSYLVSPDVRILSIIFENIPKTPKSLQIISLSGNGIFQLILLTQSNNYENKILIVKKEVEDYQWTKKNVYLNGLQKEGQIYNIVIEDKNKVFMNKLSPSDVQDLIIYPQKQCIDCSSFHLESNFEFLIKKNRIQSDRSSYYIHIFHEIQSKLESFVFRKSLHQLTQQKEYTIEILLNLKIQLPISALLPHSLQSGTKVYHISLRLNDKNISLTLKQIKYQQNVDEPLFIQPGIYYISQTNALLNNI